MDKKTLRLGILGIVGIVLLCACVIALFVFVYFVPRGVSENQDLYTVAIYNFLGSSGQGNNGEVPIASELGIVETDSHGRVLFYYHEGIGVCGYGIMQKSQDGYAYFYADDCVIPAVDDWDYREITHAEWFTQEELDSFKVRNDWNQPIDEEKCEKRQIVDVAPKSQLNLKNSDLDNMARSYLSRNGYRCSGKRVYASCNFYMADLYGREMYYMYINNYRVQLFPENALLIIVVNPDGTCDYKSGITIIEDTNNYREKLKEFKKNCEWNTPI